MFDLEIFDEVRKEFLSHLRYTRGHSPRTCYNYHSDLGIWAGFIAEAGKDWQRVGTADVEQFTAWQLRERVIGKGDRERLVPLPAAFGQTFGAWLQDRPAEEWVFAQRPQGHPPGAGAARAYLRRLKEMACIAKPLTPHKLRHTYATNRLNAGAELVDIKALLGHESISTTQIYTNVGQERMATVVNKL
jgi:site-specific recombinase XerD